MLPGDALSVAIKSLIGYGFLIGNPNTMHYIPNPPPVRSQVRIDVYDAGNPEFPSAASLQASVFDADNIEAAPFLGNPIDDAGIIADTNQNDYTTLTFGLAPYVGKTVYFAYRMSSNVQNAYAIGLSNFATGC